MSSLVQTVINSRLLPLFLLAFDIDPAILPSFSVIIRFLPFWPFQHNEVHHGMTREVGIKCASSISPTDSPSTDLLVLNY